MSGTAHPEVVILNTALELPPGERQAYLDEACAGDFELRKRVDRLIAAHENANGFLESSPSGFLGQTVRLSVPVREQTGDRIGRYKLLQQIGEGGCGVVYMAEQEEPVRRRVALKIIKLGMDTKSVIARFEAERQALALMDHPNIAKVFDAGATDTGRPYFVMELVRGIKITEFCDLNEISTHERLRLFIPICQAIQHAHQKGIIHRDIKPSNVLVTINDGVPVPKVIDFGIAKATTGRLTDQTLFTAFEQFLGTPAYMSPEQAVMTSLDVDTRTDIYSLGVMLYELLTGSPPFDQKELLAAGLDEIRRTIREREPPCPSRRLSTMEAAALSTKAKQRHADAPKLIHLIKGDLDWIVTKCLEKDRARRYETANGLAMDLQRHLNTEPVIARPPSRLYEFQKTVRRHKMGFAAAGLVTMTLVIGLVISSVAWVRERQARERAVRAEQEQTRLREQAEQERRKVQDLAESMGHRLWDFSGKDSGNPAPNVSEQLIAESLRLFEQASQEYPENRYFRQEQAFSHRILADSLGRQGRMSESQAQFHAAAELYAQLKADDPTNAHYLQEEAFTFWQLGLVLKAAGQTDAAASAYRKSIALHRELVETSPEGWAARPRLAVVLFDHGDRDEAEAIVSEAEAAAQQHVGADDGAVQQYYFWLGLAYTRLGEAAKAAAAFHNAAEHGLTAALNFGAWLLATHPDPGVRDGARAVDLAAKAVEKTGRANARYLDTLAAALAESGDFTEAVRVQQEAIALLPAADIDRIADFKDRLHLYELDTPFRDASINQNSAEPE